jgi:hypothetical protein
MGRGRCGFKQCDVTRAVKGARKAGVEVIRIEIDREGNITIQTAPPDVAGNAAAHETPEDLKELL